ncbi:MAG: hypothetical protein ACRC8A_02365 [Microcoleaceae cyanobacterium]
MISILSARAKSLPHVHDLDDDLALPSIYCFMDQLPPQQPLNIARCYHKTRNLVVDYALFAAILGLNPFSNLLLVTVLMVELLVFKQ